MYEPNLEEVIAKLVGVTLSEDHVRSIVGAPSIEACFGMSHWDWYGARLSAAKSGSRGSEN